MLVLTLGDQQHNLFLLLCVGWSQRLLQKLLGTLFYNQGAVLVLISSGGRVRKNLDRWLELAALFLLGRQLAQAMLLIW